MTENAMDVEGKFIGQIWMKIALEFFFGLRMASGHGRRLKVKIYRILGREPH